MKVSFAVGVALFVLGLVLGVVGIAGGSDPELIHSVTSEAPAGSSLSAVAIPLISGLALAAGGLLVGLSMGNWRHPRSGHEPGDAVVDPEGHHKMKHV